mmetsp:Transcript_19067/g.26507  ORF Transcript_19067/g.26507 Transcript_19067/m.26507 type:complete len:423 (-) Transcript_19067:662-1930(-)
MVSGQNINLHLGACDTVGKVAEPWAGARLEVVAHIRHLVETLRGEVDSFEVGLVDELLPGGSFRHAVAEGLEALGYLAACEEYRHAIDIGAHGGCRGRRVWDFVCSCFSNMHILNRHTKCPRRYLYHLRVKALPHFSTPVRHQYRSIGVYVHQRTTLIHKLGSKCDAKLGRNKGHAALPPSVFLVKLPGLFDPALKLRPRLALAPRAAHGAVREHLAEVRRLALLVQILLPEDLSRDVKRPGDVIDGRLRHHQPLRSPEAPEGRVGGHVGLAGEAVRSDVRDVVDVVHVEEAAVHHRDREVLAPPSVGVEPDVEGSQLAVLGEADLVLPDEGMALARGGHVHVAVKHDAHRPSQLLSSDRGRRGVIHGARLLPAEAAPHPLDLAHHLVDGDPEVVGDALDGGIRVLRARKDGHLAVLPRNGL